VSNARCLPAALPRRRARRQVDGVLAQLRRTQGILDDLDESLKVGGQLRVAGRQAGRQARMFAGVR
jgi:hypothetical protein